MSLPHHQPLLLHHLYWRAGFGPAPAELAQSLSPRQALRQLLQHATLVQPLAVPGLLTDDAMELRPAPTGPRTAEQRRLRNQQLRQAYLQLNTSWLRQMATSPAQLREKLTFFWHGHFACRVRNPAAALRLNNTIRRLALGKFSDLLMAVSKEPAMLQFLNNQQNRRQHPNENFAREVMELFTLGRGQYTEHDVQEAARAFTGWGFNREGEFVFRPNLHDDGPKTFLGHTGNFRGEEVLELILAQPRTAEFITTKLYRFFVNDTPNPAHIQPLAAAFRASQYDIGELMERLFSADWFYEAAQVGTRIKSPVELLVGLMRTLNLTLADERPLLAMQKALGQTLFQPPNVAGWPGGRSWIDSSSLLYRLQLPAVLLRHAEFSVALKEDENDLVPQLTSAERSFRQPVASRAELGPLQAAMARAAPAPPAQVLSQLLLQVPLRAPALQAVQQTAAAAPATEQFPALLTALLSLPEYQLM